MLAGTGPEVANGAGLDCNGHALGRAVLASPTPRGLMFGQGMRFHHNWIRNLGDDA